MIAADRQFTNDADIERIANAMIACTLPTAEWTHAAHWACALWLIARRPDLHPPADMPGLIRRYNESTGNRNTETAGYHETITQASLRAARARLAEAEPGAPVVPTLDRLLASPLGRSSWLLAYWSKDRLMSVEARREWVEPDLAAFSYPVFPGRSSRVLVGLGPTVLAGGMTTSRLFVTEIYRAALADAELNADLLATSKMLAREDKAGRAWCRENGYQGYTSYASLDDLPQRATCFDQLVRVLKPHVEGFAGQLQMDLRGKRLKLDNIWVNLLEPGGSHTGHIHPHCVLSGTYYVRVPDGASSLKFEDPRLPMMMSAPAPREDADEEHRRFVYVAPKAGEVLLWESWLRHEVSVNRATSARVSVSFNYRL